jgi:AraC family transcriptional regulator, regulatory protein of adaptative response / methylated-DNA-[protein]-cysteine methyltransferase
MTTTTMTAARSIARPSAAVEADPRWARIVARDRSADGAFWYSVLTTGVYCRPWCPSRTANPKNVGLHATLADARATGFRPCKRCRPDGPSPQADNAAMVAKACRLIARSEQPPSLTRLASAMQISPGHFHRLFKAATGLTPKGYAAAHRAVRLRHELVRSDTVTAAIYRSGFRSNGRFYAASTDMLGMTPTRYRAGGADEAIRFAAGRCSLGAILVASSDKGVAAILIGDDPAALLRDLRDRFAKARLIGADRDYEALVARVVGLVDAPGTGLDLPRDVRGTAFRQRVWQALREIPAATRVSDADLARIIVARKRALLAREASAA